MTTDQVEDEEETTTESGNTDKMVEGEDEVSVEQWAQWEEMDKNGEEKEEQEHHEERSEDLQEERSDRPRRSNAGGGIHRLEPSMRGKTHHTHNTRVMFMQARKEVESKEDKWCKDIFGKVVDVCFTQMNTKKGIHTYRQ